MRKINVEGSSNVVEIAYDEATSQAEVVFKGGARYSASMPKDEFDAFEQAAVDEDISTGSYFHKNLKGRFDWKKL